MTFDQDEINFYTTDLKNMIAEFESLEPEERKLCESLEEDARLLYDRVLEISSLSPDEQEELYEDLESFYDFIEQEEESLMDQDSDYEPDETDFHSDFDELENTEDAVEFLTAVLNALPENTKDLTPEQLDELRQLLNQLEEYDNLDPDTLEQIDKKLIELEDEMDKSQG